MRANLFLLALVTASASALAQTSTAPVGYITREFPATGAATTTYLSAPLAPAASYSGVVAAMGTNSIQIATSDWTSNQFVATPAHVLITSGAEAGRSLRILANTADELTVDIADNSAQDVALSTAGFTVSAGDSFEIIADETLDSFFGAIVVGGPDATSADQVGLWDGAASAFDFYYLNTSWGHWVKSNDAAMADADGVAIPSNAAMALVQPSGRLATSMVMAGAAPTVAPLLKMSAAGVTQDWGMPFPIDLTLGQLKLETNWVKKNNFAKADALAIYQQAKAKWRFYREQKDGAWVRSADGNSKNDTVIEAGSVLGFIKHRDTSGAASFVQVALPY